MHNPFNKGEERTTGCLNHTASNGQGFAREVWWQNPRYKGKAPHYSIFGCNRCESCTTRAFSDLIRCIPGVGSVRKRKEGHPRGMSLRHTYHRVSTQATSTMISATTLMTSHTHHRASTPATSTMISATTLMTSHTWPSFNPSNINHDLCHYTDDVTQASPGFNPSNIANPNYTSSARANFCLK
jgi:hypothetical protein